MRDLDTTLAGYAVYREGDLQLLCNARSEEEALSALRTMLDIPPPQPDLSAEEAREKRNLGQVWAKRSDGDCLFVMTKDSNTDKIDRLLAREMSDQHTAA